MKTEKVKYSVTVGKSTEQGETEMIVETREEFEERERKEKEGK